MLEEYPVTEFLILPGHHLYKMDYQRLIEAHRNSKADITIVALNAIRDKHPGFGLLRVNPVNQVIEFSMKSERETITSISVSVFLNLRFIKLDSDFARCLFEKRLSQNAGKKLKKIRQCCFW